MGVPFCPAARVQPAGEAVSRQYVHSLFIDSEGQLSSCGVQGGGFPGVLGHGEGVTRVNTPTPLPSPLGGERAVSVSAGGYQSFALTSSGALWSCGVGAYGRLGHGDQQNQVLAKQIEAFAGQRVIAVSAGDVHTLAITADGAVWSWGSGRTGKLGHGTDLSNQWEPKKVEALASKRVVAVSAGYCHSLALIADGVVFSWGEGESGCLGHGTKRNRSRPGKIEALEGQHVIAVSAGRSYSLAVTANGALWSWGDACFGSLGHNDHLNHLLPKKIDALAGHRVVAVSAGLHHNLALTADGTVWSCGGGYFGQLGHGDGQCHPQPKKVEALAGQRVVAVSAGSEHSLTVTANGAVFTWGGGMYGCLGHGDGIANALLPKKVESLEL